MSLTILIKSSSVNSLTFLGTEPCGILPYIEMGETEGVSTFSLPMTDDTLSQPISIDVIFPMGNYIESHVHVCIGVIKPPYLIHLLTKTLFLQVGENGYFTFNGFSGFSPFFFHEGSLPLVAPFFTDVDTSVGVGEVEYEVHTEATSRTILSDVSNLINNCTGKQFIGTWLLVATWEDVPAYGEDPTVVSYNSKTYLNFHLYNFCPVDQHIPGYSCDRLNKFLCSFHLLLWRPVILVWCCDWI